MKIKARMHVQESKLIVQESKLIGFGADQERVHRADQNQEQA